MPYEIEAGTDQEMMGLTLATVNDTTACAEVKSMASSGEKVAVRVWTPAFSTAPSSGM